MTRRASTWSGERRVIVSFHAHPDDEALLTGGTLARLAADGHRVVLVVATAGEAGLADPGGGELGARRRAELAVAARALGIARVELLGHADSGLDRPAHAAAGSTSLRFADVDVEEAATRLAAILAEEGADVLTSYDAAGGYGHPDHLQVHRVGQRAAQLAGTPVLLEATIDRTTIVGVLRLLRILARVLPLPRLPASDEVFTARAELTHRIDVRAQLEAKRAALRAHGSQIRGGPRTLRLLLALPPPLARRVLGYEWFVEAGRPPGMRLATDVLDALSAGGPDL